MSAVETRTEESEAVPVSRTPRRAPRDLGPVFEFALYLAITLVVIWPVTFHLTTRTIGSGDAEAYVWMNWRVGELISSGHILPTRIPDAVWPYGSNLLTSDGYLPVYVGGLWSVVFAPVLAYNLAVITASMLNFFAARALAKRFSARRSVWIVVAIAYATAPAIQMRFFGHYTFTWAFTLPLLVAMAIDTARGGPVRPVRLGLLLFVAYLCSIFYLLFGALAYALICFLARPRDWARLAIQVGAAACIALVLMSPFVVARLRLDRDERNAGGTAVLAEEAVELSADIESVVVQPYTSRLELPGQEGAQRALGRNVVEATIFPGFLLLLGLGALVVLRTRLRIPLLVAIAVTWLMTLGPSLRAHGFVVFTHASGSVRWLPFALVQAVPGLGMIRTPNRASWALAALLATGLAIGLDWGLQRLRTVAARTVTIGLCGLLLLTNLVTPINYAVVAPSATVRNALEEIATRAEGNDAVVFLPADCYDDLINNGTLQVYFEQPMLGCQANAATIPWYSGFDRIIDSAPLAGLRCQANWLGRRFTPHAPDVMIDAAGMKELRETLDVRFYIVDKLVATTNPNCVPARIQAITEEVAAHSELLGEDERWAVYDAFPAGTDASRPAATRARSTS